MPEANEKGAFVPNVVDRRKGSAPQTTRFRDDSWSAIASQLWIANAQFSTVAGAAVLAKTAVAPIERIKVVPLEIPSS